MREFRSVVLILLGYLALASAYFFAVPLFEAPDAYYHFAVIQHIASTGKLPTPADIQESRSQPWRQMAFHAPLYYVIGSQLIRPIDTNDFVTYHRNPHAAIGEPGADDNRNFMAHVGDPWHGTGLAVRVIRLFSMSLGGVTLVGVYMLARRIFGDRPSLVLATVLIVALNPQFLFLHVSVNNDTLLIALSTNIMALLVLMIRTQLTRRRIIILSVLLSLNSISKVSGLSLYVLFGLVLIYVSNRDRIPHRTTLGYLAIVVLSFVLIAGWWYWRNLMLYGDPTASTLVAQATQPRSGAIDVVAELRGMFYSFWALFGWFNILVPAVFYDWMALLCGLGLLGSLLAIWRNWQHWNHDNRALVVIFSVFSVMFLGQWWWFNTQVQASQGRLLFLMLGPLGCLLAFGWSKFGIRWLDAGLLVPVFLGATVFPLGVIRPVYQPADQILREHWQPEPEMVSIPVRQPWEERACLNLWVSGPTWDGKSGAITVDLAWEATCTVSGFWSVFAHFSDLEQESCIAGDTSHILSQYDSMPDGGRTPIPAIKPGYVLVDQFSVRIPDEITRDRDWHIQVGLYDAGGTFIRAFFMPGLAQGLAESEDVFIGNCSPELVNLRVRREAQ